MSFSGPREPDPFAGLVVQLGGRSVERASLLLSLTYRMFAIAAALALFGALMVYSASAMIAVRGVIDPFEPKAPPT